MPVFPHVSTQMVMKIAIAITVLAVLLTPWLRARRRRPPQWQPPSGPNPRQVTPAPRQPATPTRVTEEPRRTQSVATTPQLSRLESLLRLAILDVGARDRLVADAMRKTGGYREAAVQRVLDDLHRDNERW